MKKKESVNLLEEDTKKEETTGEAAEAVADAPVREEGDKTAQQPEDGTKNGTDEKTDGTDAKKPQSDAIIREIKKEKKKKKSIVPFIVIGVVVVLLIVLVIVISSAAKKALEGMTENKTEVQAFGMQDISTYINATGVLESKNVEYVSSTLTYPVERVEVELGDEVHVGDLLCVLDTTELEKDIYNLEKQATAEDKQKAKQLEISRHQLNTATHSANGQIVDVARELKKGKEAYDKAVAQLQEAQQISDQAKGAYDALAKEYADSVSANSLPPESLEELKKKMDLAKASFDATLKPLAEYTAARNAAADTYEALSDNYNKVIVAANDSLISAKDSQELTYITGLGVSQTALQLAKYYEQRESANITAAQDGIVTAIYAKEGAAAAGTLMQIEDRSHFKINVDIKERDIFKIAEGQEVDITNDSIKEVSGKGTVTKVLDFVPAAPAQSATSQNLQVATSSPSYRATITVDSGENLLLGMSVKARIHVGSNESLMAVPYTAVMGEDDEATVYVARELGNNLYQAEEVSVELGQSSDYYTEIIGGDLEEGDLVVLYPDMVTPGGVISIDEKKE